MVVPQLKRTSAGCPDMAIELLKPFVMKRLVDLNHAQNISPPSGWWSGTAVVWDVLE